ncbi:MAG: caspase family protein, partial [Candidatus Delongbacteria bacterium]|nr:caspase family protein [Candidatus Delongbacteria bacterium]
MKHKLIFFLTLALLLNISFAKRTAMLVGIENYEAFAPLENCHGDVDDMKELLKQARFEEDKFWVLKDANYGEFITASKIFTDVNAFARGVDEGDEVIFFFSGHGVGGSDGNNYLLGADGNIDNPEKYSISVEEIKKIIKEKKPAEIVLIVDACRNFIKKEGKGSSQPVESKMNISKGIQVIPTIGTQSQEQSGKTIVKTIFAASEGQQSYERKEKNNGAFTYYMTYLLDSPNSAIDIDGSKDGVITIEDLVLFTDNRINDWTKSQGLPAMNPNYQTEGGITYEPFMLFRYNAEQVVQEQKKEGSKPIFQYDEKAELEKIKKFTEKKEYLTEQLPVYQPKISKAKKIEVDNTDLTSWELALSQEQEIKEAKAEEARKENEAKEKEQIYNDLKNKYNLIITELDNTGDIFEKHEKLEKLRNEVNTVKYPEIKQKILALLE